MTDIGANAWTSKALKAIAAVLKKRFPNLTVDETIGLAIDLLTAVREIES